MYMLTKTVQVFENKYTETYTHSMENVQYKISDLLAQFPLRLCV